MAALKKETVKVEKVVEVEEMQYTLTLNFDEVRRLHALLGASETGCGLDDVWQALRKEFGLLPDLEVVDTDGAPLDTYSFKGA